jgi:hypothetical protein
MTLSTVDIRYRQIKQDDKMTMSCQSVTTWKEHGLPSIKAIEEAEENYEKVESECDVTRSAAVRGKKD